MSTNYATGRPRVGFFRRLLLLLGVVVLCVVALAMILGGAYLVETFLL